MSEDTEDVAPNCVEDEQFLGRKVDPGATTRCRKCMHVNRAYIPLKMIYFFCMAGEACLLPYRSIFMKHLGLSARQTGIIWTVERVISIILPPFLGAITDKSRRPKLVLIILLLSGSMLLLAMYFVPQEQLLKVEKNSTVLSSEEITSTNTSACWALNCPRHIGPCIAGTPSSWDPACEDVEDLSKIETFWCSARVENSAALSPMTTSPPNNHSGPHLLPNLSDLSTKNSYEIECALHWGVNGSEVVILPVNDAYYVIRGVAEAHVYVDVGRRLCVSYVPASSAGERSCGELQHNPIDEYGATFWLIFSLVALSSCATIGSRPVIESSVLTALGPENRHKFGLQRLWASVGYGSAALLVGYFKDRSSDVVGLAGGSNRAFLPMFLGAVIGLVLSAVVASRLPISVSSKEKKKTRLKDIRFVLMKPKAVAFICLTMFYGINIAVQEVYLFWLAENKLNAPTSVLGASAFVGAMLGIPFCIAAGPLIKRFGHTSLICFGMIVFSTRVILCGVVTEAWQLIVTESLRSISWGLTWVVLCSYTAKISPPGLEVLTMGITQATLWGLGYITGALAGGVLFEIIGGDKIFILFGSMSLVASILFGIYTFCTRNQDDNSFDDIIDELKEAGRGGNRSLSPTKDIEG